MSLEDKAGHSGWSGLLAFFEVWQMKVSIACSGVYGITGGRRTLANKVSFTGLRMPRLSAAMPRTTAPRTVYVTPTGKKYHYSSSCNGGSYSAVTLDNALSRGLTACEKCA